MTTRRSRGKATVTSLRLCSRAPRTTSWSWGMTGEVYALDRNWNVRSCQLVSPSRPNPQAIRLACGRTRSGGNGVTDQDRLERFAELVVRVGANVRRRQDVLRSADVAHAPISRAVADAAYRSGAGRVVLEYTDPHVRRSAIVHGPEDGLRSTYRWEVARFDELRERG